MAIPYPPSDASGDLKGHHRVTITAYPRQPQWLVRSSALTLNSHGACTQEDSYLFDATTLVEAELALEICSGCPVKALCFEVVRPVQSYFDGVCAGEVYVNGRLVRRHRRRGRRPKDPTVVA